MLEQFNTNPTQITGIVSFAATALACANAARRERFKNAMIWRVLTFINCIFVLDIIFGLRHRIHDRLVTTFIEIGKYGQRREPQELMVIIITFVTVAAVCSVLFLIRGNSSWALLFAIAVTFALLGLFAIEIVSLHALDAIFYRPVGAVLLIGWVWSVANLAIILATLTASGETTT